MATASHTTEILIIGGGIAGCSVAAHLAPHASVVLLESASELAREGTAQNAGLIRRLDPEPWDRSLAQRTYDYLFERGDALSTKTGAVLALARDPIGLHDACAHLRARQIAVESAKQDDFPLLSKASLSKVWFLPDERTGDGPELAQHLIETAHQHGATTNINHPVQRLLIENGRCVGALTRHGPLYADLTVVACGAWAGLLATEAGLHRPLIPLRRMAAVVAADQAIAQHHPWCWIDDIGLYAKPAGASWLVSPCDERPDSVNMGRPSRGEPTAMQWQLLRSKIRAFMPHLHDSTIEQSWTGLRTFSPDRRPVLGPDGECSGLYWAAGLGGSGVSSCIGVGQALEAWILGHETSWLDPRSVSPSRHQLTRWPIYPNGDPSQAKLISSESILSL